jgi:hypothetical protein
MSVWGNTRTSAHARVCSHAAWGRVPALHHVAEARQHNLRDAAMATKHTHKYSASVVRVQMPHGSAHAQAPPHSPASRPPATRL